jgi:hypothetical protein
MQTPMQASGNIPNIEAAANLYRQESVVASSLQT